ncbi:MAG: hypothetical protein R3E79_52330 [Caldilineaceae bacterium]
MFAQFKKSLWRTAWYRVQQFRQGWQASVQPAELVAAVGYLPVLAADRFQQLPRDAQRHSLNVLQTLQRQGPLSPDLAAAALLHDVGKLAADEAGLRINLWVRGPLVLLEHVAPQLLARWASPDVGHGWRYLLYVHQMHPLIGAQWATAWGCTPLTCWLIEHHQDHLATAPRNEAEQLLLLLQWADSEN